MKLILISIVYYIEALIFDMGIRLIMKLRFNTSSAAYLSRRFERLGERLSVHESIIRKSIFSHN